MISKYFILFVLGIFLIAGCVGSSPPSDHLVPPTEVQTNNAPQEPSQDITENQVNTSTPEIQVATQTSVNSSANSSTNTSSENSCPPESCTTLDWRSRAQQLNIPDYQKEIDSSGKLVLSSNQFQIVLPYDSPSAEEFGRIQLYGLRRAYNNTENLLGRAPYLQPEIIKEEFTLNLSNAGECCGPSEEGLPLYWGIREGYLPMINLESPNTRYLQREDWNQTFNGNHELTHRFVRGLSLSSFVDEGLAMYAQDHGATQPMVCGNGGYNQSGGITRYSYLCYNNMFRIYNTGDCFWQRIEELYGPDMVKRIVTRMYNKEERDEMQTYYPYPGSPTARWTSFSGQLLIDLNQAFVPEIGERFWNDFSDFGFSPDMAEGQTYESELVRAQCNLA